MPFYCVVLSVDLTYLFEGINEAEMTLKSQIDYTCSQCNRAWLPHRSGLLCPICGRPVPDAEVTGILDEALESARFNKRLYGKYDVEYWLTRRMGDRYLEWGFKALQIAEANAGRAPQAIALSALMEINLEDAADLREHLVDFLSVLVEKFRVAKTAAPDDWEQMPAPEKPFFGRKIIDDV